KGGRRERAARLLSEACTARQIATTDCGLLAVTALRPAEGIRRPGGRRMAEACQRMLSSAGNVSTRLHLVQA
ncbi:MAG: hypothetical protein NTU91_13215, partial [Chloroflexi bacterium]|nr:hypothetical protein [Chloroflexota bacterium]